MLIYDEVNARPVAWVLPLLSLLGCGQGSEAGENATGGPNANADGDCLTDAEEGAAGTDPNQADSDGDGLSDCDELARGSNAVAADSDGDGLSDGQEVACVSDPLDEAEKCFACGWKHNDPGNLVSTGKDEGAVIDDMQLVDQCLEPVSLWDFAATAGSPSPKPAEYHILVMSGAW